MISQKELLQAYHKFIKGKSKKRDVRQFMLDAEAELVDLYEDISAGRYRHSVYQTFYLQDSKRREINKAAVRDRVVHQLVYNRLAVLYDKAFYHHSYAARLGKGSHRAINAFRQMSASASVGHHRPVYALKLDVRKFFASINKDKLFELACRKIDDEKLKELVKEIIYSFNVGKSFGMPLGNLTSQIFANIYLHEADLFIKNKLKAKYYIRYMDDMIIISANPEEIAVYAEKVKIFLEDLLFLSIHNDRINHKLTEGVDFLGYIIFPYHLILRPKTARRLLRQINQNNLPSYSGLLRFCKSFRFSGRILFTCNCQSGKILP